VLILKESLKSKPVNKFYTISCLYFPELQVCCDAKWLQTFRASWT